MVTSDPDDLRRSGPAGGGVAERALLQSVVKNHPLVDGNKRLGWLATATFLELNGVEVTKAPNADIYE